MKAHYINILLFSLPLNIMAHNKNKTSITPHHTPTTRLLCECDIYAPSNYDNDPQMKEVMEYFNKQTQQRFHEYNERIQEKRKQCKEQCNKEIQKIILKDKLEKELMDKIVTLDTDIQSDAIPTCICEKSIADKMEKGCLRCGGILGAAMPELGSIGGSLLSALYAWKPTALKVATQYAIDKGFAFGKVYGDIRGRKIVITFLEKLGVKDFCPDLFESIGTTTDYYDASKIINAILAKKTEACSAGTLSSANGPMCTKFEIEFGLMDAATHSPKGPPANEAIPQTIKGLVSKATDTANARAAEVAATKKLAVETAQKGAIETTFMGNQTAIIASIVAIVVIVLIMVIIYLILRYRRKKKMKKKLQYIKLLEE
ncbi:rifin PIR protein, putative [Plasmodium reichenowi]|uniref:Rifin PIR protein, putative n=1 Tax=Plasmodium reichenowi TaxID=5854 RepID=A0A2P9DSF7_PLARE|nr:rifin PIR protein, putative [Plasmodium reichenowi]